MLYSILFALTALLLTLMLYLIVRYLVWYLLIEAMPEPIVLALMHEDVVARYTVLALAQGIAKIRKRE